MYPVCALIARLQLAVEFFSLFLNGKDGSKLLFFSQLLPIYKVNRQVSLCDNPRLVNFRLVLPLSLVPFHYSACSKIWPKPV